MTKELAIKLLRGDVLGTTEQTQEAVTMAVRALSQPDVTDTNVGDTVSRAQAIKAIEDLQDCYNGFSDTYDKACIIGVLEELPSAERKGRWKGAGMGDYMCSLCAEWVSGNRYHYCPNCGARMEA